MNTTVPRPALVVDFGAQYTQLIARRVREVSIYSKIVAHTMPTADMLAKEPATVILSGGPSSVYKDGTPSIDSAIFDTGVPVLGICYGFQTMAQALDGTVKRTGIRKYGHTDANITVGLCLFTNTPGNQVMWTSHGDVIQAAPSGFEVTVSTTQTPVTAFENRERHLFDLQWHPKVAYSAFGRDALKNFLYEGADVEPSWTPGSAADEQVERIREQIGDAQVICALSGGVDSSVAAILVHEAAGDQLTCFFVDHGLLRAGEREQVENDYVRGTGIRIIACDESKHFLPALAGVSDPKTKRKITGREFVHSFEATQKQVIKEAGAKDGAKFLVQGILYSDVVESSGNEGAANIKSHHNVGSLSDDMTFKPVEPLRALFKDEVRAVGRELGLPDYLVDRQPFPGPGLGIRIIGEVTKERLDTLRAADLIAHGRLSVAGPDSQIWQCPVVLLADVRSVGVQDGGRTYGHPIVLRPVSLEDAMIADWTRLPYEALTKISTRIVSMMPEVNHVVLDVTGRPPATVEWK